MTESKTVTNLVRCILEVVGAAKRHLTFTVSLAAHRVAESRDIEDFFAVHDSDGDKNLDYDEIMSKDSGRRLLSYIATCLDDEDSWLLSRERRRKHA